jgi:streptogramin lyase
MNYAIRLRPTSSARLLGVATVSCALPAGCLNDHLHPHPGTALSRMRDLRRGDPSSGKLTATHVPADAGPSFLAPSCDGFMWITETRAGAIARLDPDSHTTEYQIPSSENIPEYIFWGPSRLLWFTSFAPIGRANASGNVTAWKSAAPLHFRQP